MDEPPEKLLTDQQAADFLQVSVNSVRFYRAQRRIHFYRVGKHPRIPLSEILRFLKEDSGKITVPIGSDQEASNGTT
jgi:excisionase family DNA binding protein